MKTVVIVGGGSSAHTLVSLLGSKFKVNLLSSRPQEWQPEVTTEYRDIDNRCLDRIQGRLAKVSDKPGEVVPEADIAILCMPIHQYRQALANIGPHLNRTRPVAVGAVYGQAGVNWMMEELIAREKLDNLVYFSFGLLPWICRFEKYGSIGVNYGSKAVNVAAVYPKEKFDELNEVFFDSVCFDYFKTGRFVQSDNFLSLTLSVDNQIIHPSRCYGLCAGNGGIWRSKEDAPYFYRDYDDLSALYLKRLDDDYSSIRNQFKRRYPGKDFRYMLNYLDLEHLSYQSRSTNIKDSFVNSKTLGAIKPPICRNDRNEWTLDLQHRFFMDDIFYGICIAKWMADQFELAVPMIDEILQWSEKLRVGSFLTPDRKLKKNPSDFTREFRYGIPPCYNRMTIDSVVD